MISTIIESDIGREKTGTEVPLIPEIRDDVLKQVRVIKTDVKHLL